MILTKKVLQISLSLQLKINSMSVKLTLGKINRLLLEVKRCLKEGIFELPLCKCNKQFDLTIMSMTRRDPNPIIFKKSSVSLVLRIVQILTIVRKLLMNSKFVTKRNLYYQLVKYYPFYSLLDEDLLIICDSLKVQRSQLNIIVSSKLQLFWFNSVKFNKEEGVRVELAYKKFIQDIQHLDLQEKLEQQNKTISNEPSFAQKQHIQLMPHQIFKIPNCPKLEVKIHCPVDSGLEKEKKINFLIMQKESLFEMISQSFSYKLPAKNQNWLLINSKGYPDMTALQFVGEILKISKNQDIQFFYIGDNDVYGIDIMLNYAIGNQYFEGLWSKLKWLCRFDQLVSILNDKDKDFEQKFQQYEYRKQTSEDKKKAKEMLCRDYFQVQRMIEQSKQNLNHRDMKKEISFIQKSSQWRKVIQKFIEKNYQCEVQSYFKKSLHPFDIVQLMIQRHLYI